MSCHSSSTPSRIPLADGRQTAKRFALYFLPCCAIAAAVLWAVSRNHYRQRLGQLRQAEEKRVALQRESITRDFDAILTDLVLLSESGEVQQLVGSPSFQGRQEVERRFRDFAQAKQIYDQIRLLDEQGQEVVRINYDGRQAIVVPPERLQAKGDRYYFQSARQLSPGQVFVSSFDLNVEDGRIERPIKPTVRLATPVTGKSPSAHGFLVLNYLGQVMLRRFAQLGGQGSGEAMLINENGYWLYAPQPWKCWGFMDPDRRDVRFQKEFPEAWRRIEQNESGHFQTSGGMFTFQTVSPFSGSSRTSGRLPPDVLGAGGIPRWKIVSHLSDEALKMATRDDRQVLTQLAVASLLLIGLSSWAVARHAVSREASERHLRDSQARFQQMASSISEVFWLAARDRRKLTYASPAFQNIWGSTAESIDVVERQWMEAIEPEDRPRAEAAIFGGGGKEFSVEYRIRRPDGTVRWIWDHGFPVFEGSQLTGYAGIAEDVTHLKEAQEQLLQSARLAAVGEAITGLAHESRNALQRGQACLEMLRKRLADRPECAQLADRLQNALRELHGIYERVRMFSAPVMLARCHSDLRQVWDETCDKLNEEIIRRNAHIVHVAEKKVQTWAWVDEVALGQVFRNVLENALSDDLDSQCQRAEPTITVEWSSDLHGDDGPLRIRIRDNGPGLSEELCQRIFDPFFTTRTRGTGLGLSICRRLIEAHGGTITARPAAPRGLVIEVALPRTCAHELSVAADRHC